MGTIQYQTALQDIGSCAKDGKQMMKCQEQVNKVKTRSNKNQTDR